MNLCSMFGTLVIGALSWVPSDVSQFWVEPDKPALLEFDVKKDETVESGSRSDSVKFVVRTTDGEMLKEGEGEIVGERLAIRTTLPQGYFELELPESNQAFGVASQPPFCPSDAILASSAKERNDLRLRDDFFGIDAASTWLVQDDKTREALIRNARRIGVATYRERLSWGRVEPQENVFDFNGDRNSETVRAAALKYDMPVLELFHSAPDWAGHVGTYPEDLIKTANSWGAIGKRWGRYWNSIEVWNEPDISFSGNLPADQYAPVLKTVAQELARKGITTPVVGGIIATFRDNFMDSFADNGGLDACDIFSFHTYCRAPEMESVCLRYHNWLVKNHAEWKPVWITECGRPWKKGTERPNREADLESAIDIVEKGVVAKAMGYDSYFPFVYVFYEENDNNFGMSDKNSAPLRSIAGYARMIYLLSGKDCIGNWKVDGSDAAWLFVDRENGEQIAVVYASERKKGRVVKLPCKPVFAERVTGEHVDANDSNELDFSDGLLFVKLPYDFKAELNQSTEVDQARLLRVQAREKHGVDARRNDDVVMRFDFDKEVVSATNGGYSLLDPEIKEFQGRLSVFNFSNESKTLPVSAEAIVNKSGSSEKIDDCATYATSSYPSEKFYAGKLVVEATYNKDAAKMTAPSGFEIYSNVDDEWIKCDASLAIGFTSAVIDTSDACSPFKNGAREYAKKDAKDFLFAVVPYFGTGKSVSPAFCSDPAYITEDECVDAGETWTPSTTTGYKISQTDLGAKNGVYTTSEDFQEFIDAWAE